MPRYDDAIREKIADWRFLGSQAAFTPSATSYEKHRSIVAGFRSGKTSHLLKTAILLSYFVPDNYGFLGRATGESLKQFLVDPFLDEICPPELIVGRPEAIGQTGKKVTLRTTDPARTSTLLFNYIHDPQTGKFHLAGGNWGFFGVSQAEEITRDEYMKLVGRLSRNVPRSFALSEANDAGKNWIWEDFFKGGDFKISDEEMTQGTFFKRVLKENRVGIVARSEENRVSNGGFVTDDYFDELRRTYSLAWQNRHLRVTFENFSGKVWMDYTTSSVHNIRPFNIPEDWPWLVVVDVGGSAEWSIGVYRTDPDGFTIRTDGFHPANVNANVVLNWISSRVPCDKARFVIDPENRVFTIQMQDTLGILAEPAVKPILSGIHTASTWLTPQKRPLPSWANTQSEQWQEALRKSGVPLFFVFDTPECLPFREHIDAYQWDEKKKDTPKVDEHEHSADEFRYLCMSKPSRAERPIRDPFEHLKADPASYESAKRGERLLAQARLRQTLGNFAACSVDGEPTIWTPEAEFIQEIY